jgi:hypothetical protein
MDKKLKHLEKYLNYSIEYNHHKLLYQRIDKYLEDIYGDYQIIDKEKIIENDRLYEIIIYDITPVGHYRYAGYDLSKVLSKIMDDLKQN